MIYLAFVLILLWILKEFSKTGIFSFSLETSLNSKLIINPLTYIESFSLKKKKYGYDISERLLTREKPVSTVNLFVVLLRMHHLSFVSQNNDFLFYSEKFHKYNKKEKSY
jgi:hypothetical protein